MSDGRLAITLTGSLRFPSVFTLPASPPGTVTGPDDYPALLFPDQLGRSWTGRCRIMNPFEDSEGRIFGEIDSLTAITPPAAGLPQVRLLLRGVFRLPLNRMTFNDGLIEFAILSDEDGVEIAVSSPTLLPDGFDTRLEESLWFITGVVGTSVLLERNSAEATTTTLLPCRLPAAASLLGPPIRLQPQHAAWIVDMYLKYLKYAVDGPPGRFHPTSADLRLIHSSARSTIEQAALALPVAIEAFIRREYPVAGSPTAEIANAFQQLRKHVDAWEGDPDVRGRARSFIGQALRPNPRSALIQLSEDGPLLPRHYEAWHGLRNAFVHSLEQQGTSLEHLIARVLLLYQAFIALILHRIGYAGPVTDYTQLTWPLIPFPFTRDSS